MAGKTHLTQNFVKKTKPPVKGRETYWDDKTPGLGLRVAATGKMSYVVDFRTKSGRQRRLVIGDANLIPLVEARKIAVSISVDVAEGRDPAQERRDEKRRVRYARVNLLCDRFLEEHAKIHKKAKSAYEDERQIEKYIRKAFGKKVIEEVEFEDIQRFHSGFADRPFLANRLVALLSAMFSFAERVGLRERGLNPCRGIRKYPEQAAHRDLSPDEYYRLACALKEFEPVYYDAVDAIRLLILTGCRRNEILHLSWPEVDLEAGWLALADSKTGARAVPLNSQAVAVLKRRRKRAKKNVRWVFPSSRDSSKPVYDIKKPWMGHKRKSGRVEGIREKADLSDLRLHHLRHAFASVGSDIGLSELQVADILGHRGGTTTRRYARLTQHPSKMAVQAIGDEIEKAMNKKF